MIPLQLVLMSAVCAGEAPAGVVLDFSASWCLPCQEMSPLVSQLARQGYSIRKVDVDQERELARRFGIQNIPAFVLVVNGREVTRLVGKQSEADLRRLLARIPAPAAPAARNMIATAPPATRSAVSNPAGNSTVANPAPAVASVPAVYAPEAPAAAQPLPVTEEAPVAAPPAVAATSSAGTSRAGLFKFPFGSKAPSRPVAPAVVRAKIDDAPPAFEGSLPASPLAAAVRIRIRDTQGENFGSGTLIDSQTGRTLVLTCGHIFRNLDAKSTIEVDLFTQGAPRTYVGELVRFDKEADVGLIAIPTDSPLPVCRVAGVHHKILKDAPVSSIGCGGGEPPSVQKHRITALNRYLGPDNLECSGVPVQGRSGGCLLAKEGVIVGVCMAADPRDQRGIYAGLKAIHRLLDQCNLSRLYRTADAPDQELIADTSARTPSQNERPAQYAAQPQVHHDRFLAGNGDEPELTGADEDPAELSQSTSQGHLLPADLDEEGAAQLRAALRDAGPAEVVCVIRPIDEPRGASRVVVINRASRKFVSYLTDELEDQARVQKTTLARPAAGAKSSSGADQEPRSFSRTAATSTADRHVEPATSDKSGPQPYRRRQPK